MDELAAAMADDASDRHRTLSASVSLGASGGDPRVAQHERRRGQTGKRSPETTCCAASSIDRVGADR